MTHSKRINAMTEEEKVNYDAKKKESAKAFKERKNNAKELIKGFMSDDKATRNIPEDVKEAIKYIIGSGQRSVRAGITNLLRDRLIEKQAMSGIEIYTEFEYGTPTMKIKVRELISKAKPEDRLWVAFESGNWIVKGQGENPPEGWDGYTIPVKVESEEL